MKVIIVLAALVSMAHSSDQLVGHQQNRSLDYSLVKFDTLCSGNPTNRKRGCDVKGCGHYGAKRKNGPHKGLDIVCNDGAVVYAPFDVKLNGKAIPYANAEPPQTLINDGIKLSGKGLCFKLFYVNSKHRSGFFKRGDKIGILLPMQKVYPGITSHVHVQMCDRSDPSKYF